MIRDNGRHTEHLRFRENVCTAVCVRERVTASSITEIKTDEIPNTISYIGPTLASKFVLATVKLRTTFELPSVLEYRPAVDMTNESFVQRVIIQKGELCY